MTISRRARLLLTLGCLAAAPADLAAAVRAYFDDPPRAAAAFEALHAADPADADVAWWLARVRLDEGDAGAALALLSSEHGESVPERDVAWLRARALSALGDQRARAEAERAVHLATHPPAPDLAERRALVARLALDAGDEAAARTQVVAAGGALAGMRALTWLEPAFSLAVRAGDGWLRVGATGLAWPVPAPVGGVREGPGPDLVDDSGAPCFAAAGTRADPAPDTVGWLYVAGEAPEGSGVFTIERCGSEPHLLLAEPGASSPARIDGVLWWLRAGRPVHDGGESSVVRAVQLIAAAGGGLVVALTPRGTRLLRLDGRPIFAEDLAISRADARPWQAASPSP